MTPFSNTAKAVVVRNTHSPPPAHQQASPITPVNLDFLIITD